MKKLKNKIGMTMAELLMVVAIVVVLCGVAFIGVWAYQRSLGQLERDGIAKQIFVAAQNHLTVAYGEGYMGLKEPEKGSTETNPFGKMDSDGAYYFVVNGNIDESTVLGQMLPFGSIDETVRAGGSYIIRYQKETGMVLDVFYCTRSGSPSQFNHTFFEDDDSYEKVIATAGPGEDKKGARKNYLDGFILGWYGGEAAATLPTITLKNPTITVTNADKLSVAVKDFNVKDYSKGAMLKLIIEGLSSGAKKAIAILDANGSVITSDTRITVVDSTADSKTYSVVLDDITTQGCHFAELQSDITDKSFIPGENITIKAVSYSTTALANIAYSSQNKTNSLFASLSDVDKDANSILETAGVSSIRHLENLDQMVSKLGSLTTATSKKLEKFNVASAVQTTSLDWETFKTNTSATNTKIYYLDGASYSAVACTGAGYYFPISPGYSLTYDGKNHSISDIAVNTTGAGGLFGAVSTVSAISNLELIDFSVSGASAGALAGIMEKGALDSCTVTNVLARNKDKSPESLTRTINATNGNAGGLIGKLTGGTVQYSAAAVIVSGTQSAGGLIGEADGGTITRCYSGGHTTNGSYKEWVKNTDNSYDVTGLTAGGLVGVSSSDNINNCYSTCSVSGTTLAAGFVASATGGSITNSYATGYIDPNTTTKFAFLAKGSPTLSGNYYYRVINEIPKDGGNEGETEPMLPYPNATEVSAQIGKVQPLDLNADTYNTFTGPFAAWKNARAFDPTLVQYYSGKYPLRTVNELRADLSGDYEQVLTLPTGYENWNQFYVIVHYGDWPSPEVFFINEASN